MSEDKRVAVEPWQVLVKASEAGLVVMNTHEGEDIAGLHVSGHFFGRMAEWEKFTSSGYTVEQVEGATRSLVRLMNFALRSAKVDYQFDEGDAWSDMQKRLAVTWKAPGKRCDLDEGKEVSP